MPNRQVITPITRKNTSDRIVPDPDVNYGGYSYASLLSEARRQGLDYSTEFSRLTDEYISSDNAQERRNILLAIAAFLGAGVAVGGIGAGAAGASGSGVSVASATGNDVIGNKGSFLSNLLGSGQSGNFLSSLWDKLKDFGSSALSGLSQLGTGIVSQLANSALNYENQVKLIDKQNEYNTPAAQMQRFAEAGLNPNLIYGLGSNGNQPASGSVAPVDFDTSQRENRLVKFQMEQEARLNEAEIQERQANIRKANAEADGQDIDNNLRRQTFDTQVATATAQLNDLVNSANLKAKEINSFDDFRQAQLDLWKSQIYANMLSGHSVFGKVAIEVGEKIRQIQDYLNNKFPQYSRHMKDIDSSQPLSVMPPELYQR